MYLDITIEKLDHTPVAKQEIEIVERKGVGHPDSLTDGICEAASRVVSKFYIKKKGFTLHHNLDKGLLVGGVSNPVFGGGEIVENPTITVAGTASTLGNVDDIKMLIYEETEKYLKEHLRFVDKLDPEINVQIHHGSPDLVDLYERFGKGEIPLSNDTSFGVGFSPKTVLEELVLLTENYLNSKAIKKKYPWLGEDIKVMGTRNKNDLNLTIAAAFVSSEVANVDEYYEFKNKIRDLVNKKFGDRINVFVNTADRGESVYITVSGTSWEMGDDGQVGRGNRINGLITPARVMSLEAAAGKNPISHVGKIYNFKAQEISDLIADEFDLEEVKVMLVSKIGKPITEPFVGVKILGDGKAKRGRIQDIIEESISRKGFEDLRDKLIAGKLSIF